VGVSRGGPRARVKRSVRNLCVPAAAAAVAVYTLRATAVVAPSCFVPRLHGPDEAECISVKN